MITVPLEQGTRPWFRWCWDGLGGSDAAGVLGRSPYISTADLLAEKTLPHRDREETFAMRRGRRLEPIARDHYIRRTGLRARPLCCQHAEAPWLRASLDGYFGPDAGGRLAIVLEIKCPNWKDHEFALQGLVPMHFRPQCCHLALATGAEVVHYFSFNDGKRHFPDVHDQTALVVYEPPAEDLGELLAAEEAFWQRVIARRAELARGGRAA